MPLAAYQGRIHDRLVDLLTMVEAHVSENAEDGDTPITHEIECLASEAALAARKYLDTVSKGPRPLNPVIFCYTAPSPVPLGLSGVPETDLPDSLLAHVTAGNATWGLIVAMQYEFVHPKTIRPIRDVLNSLLHCRFFGLQFWHHSKIRDGAQIGHPIGMKFGPHSIRKGVWLDRFDPERDYRAHVVTIIDFVAALEPLIHHEWTDKEEDSFFAGLDAATYVSNEKGVYVTRLQSPGDLLAKAISISAPPCEGCGLHQPLTTADLPVS
jgi:hypothetical protein